MSLILTMNVPVGQTVTFTIGTPSSVTVFWDGINPTFYTPASPFYPNISNTYNSGYAGQIIISGNLTSFGKNSFPYLISNQWIISVTSFNTNTTNYASAFRDATNLGSVPAVLPPSATDLSYMFYNATNFNSANVSSWNVSNVTDFTGMFALTLFNQPLNSWSINTSSPVNMSAMFQSSPFNQDISGWNVSRVTNMSGMFLQTSFNQNIGGWNVQNVQFFSVMFRLNSVFNQDLSNWNTLSATNMNGMFYEATSFNNGGNPLTQVSGKWDTSNVEDMSFMFNNCPFNQDISSWNINKVNEFRSMFEQSIFNQPLNTWNINTSTTVTFDSMFKDNTNFNQNLSSWNTSQVTNMYEMFSGASQFNGDISSWDTSNVEDMSSMFEGATNFNRNLANWNILKVEYMDRMLNNSGLSVSNYSNTLIGWNSQSPSSYSVTLDALGLFYNSSAVDARNSLIDNFGWIINDSGLAPTPPPTPSSNIPPTLLKTFKIYKPDFIFGNLQFPIPDVLAKNYII